MVRHETVILAIEVFLDAPVAPDVRLRDRPGVYPDLGLALYEYKGEWRFAIDLNASSLVITSDPGAAVLFADVKDVRYLRRRIRHHPRFRGRQYGPRFAGGKWLAVAVDAPPSMDAVVARA